jgi:hypothetical protein
MSHQYLYGNEQATLAAEEVAASWKSEPKALPLINKAFEIYYDAYHATNQVEDPQYQRELRRSLDKAAKYWYPLYATVGKVNTLVGAFEHLDKNDGRWTDENVGSYNGGVGGRGFVSPVPACAASFLRAVDNNVKELHECLDNVAEGMGTVKEAQEEENTDWAKVGRGLELVEKYGKYAKPLLWLAPETIQKGAETVLEWDEKIGKAHGYASKVMTIAASDRPADKLLFTALTEVLNYVPVLGGFYGKIVAEIPAMAVHWEAFCDDYWARRGTQTYRRSKGMAPMFTE